MDTAKPMNSSRIHKPHRSAQGESISPQMALHAVRRWWKVAAPAAVVLAAISASAVWLSFEPKYQAEALVQISEHRQHIAFPDKDTSDRFVATQLELLRTPVVLGPLLKNSEIMRQREIREARDPLLFLQKNITVAAVGKSELYRIGYAAAEPAGAKQVVDAVVQSYMDYVTSTDSERRAALIVALEREMASRKATAEQLRDRVRQYSQEAGIPPSQLSPSLGGYGMAPSPISDLRARLVQSEVEIVMATAEMEYEKALSEQPIDISDEEVERAVGADLLARKQSLDARKSQLEDLKEKLTQGVNPRLQQEMARLQAEEDAFADFEKQVRGFALAEMKSQVSMQREANLTALQAKLESAQVTHQKLLEKLEAEEKNSGTTLSDQLRIDFANRELQQAEGVCDVLLARKTQLSTEQNAPERVTSLNGPEGVAVPSVPVTSFPLKNILLVVFASLCAPFGLAVGWEWFVKRVNNVEEIEQNMGVEVLGEIVTLPRFGTSQRALKRSAESRHLFEESVDGLRTTLILSDTMRDMHVLAIASAVSSEGKTSVATELAISIARTTGKATLLIDGDMRAPDVHRIFDVPVSPGLAEVLAGESTLDEAAVETDSEMLDILTAGMLTSRPHRLLHNGEFRQLLDQAREKYSYVIIDTPPVLAASEALVLAKYADATLVCAMRDRTRMSHIKRAHERLLTAGANPIGVVMSGLPVRSYASRYGSYSYGKSPTAL